jgi:integrase
MIPENVKAFLGELTGRSDDTIQNYTSFANVFWSYLDKPVAEITVQDIMRFLKWGFDVQGWKLSTQKHYGKLAQRFMSEFKDDTFIKGLKRQIRNLPKPQRYGQLYEGIYIPGDKIDNFIEAAPNSEYAAVFTMILKWGLRLNEALNQKLIDIDPKLARVTVRGKGRGSEHKLRLVLVDRKSLGKVLTFAGCTEEQITGSRVIRRKGKFVTISPRAVEVTWKLTARKIGLRHWKKLTPHDGRHSYAIDFLQKRKEQGMMALTTLKNQLGHSNINTTMIYLDIAGSEARVIVDSGEENVPSQP